MRPLIAVLALLTANPVSARVLRDGGATLELPAGKPVLFVTHASGARGLDENSTAKPGIDRAVARFKSLGWPVIYLVNCEDDHPLYMDDKKPTATICSTSGEHQVRVTTPDIYLAGGFLKLCANSTAEDAVLSALESHAEVNLTILTDAVYTGFPIPTTLKFNASRQYEPDLFYSDLFAFWGGEPLDAPYVTDLYRENRFLKTTWRPKNPEGRLNIRLLD